MRETNDIDYFVQPRLRVRPHRLPGHRPLPHGPVGPVRPGDAERPLRHDRVDRRAGLVRRQGGHAGRVAAGLEPVVLRRAAAAAPQVHPALGRRRRHVPRRRLARRHDGRGLPDRLEHVGDPRALPPGHPRPRSAPRPPTRRWASGTWCGTSSTIPPATTSGSCAAPTSRRSSARCSSWARCTRWACTCAAWCAATRRSRRPRR